MNTKKDVVKIAFFSIILIIAFAFIYWYTSASRCVSFSVDKPIRSQFSSNKDYDMCVNYYGVTIFKNPEKALLRAREDFGHVLVSIQVQQNLKTIRNDNYAKYLTYASKFFSSDENIIKETEGLTAFLDIYDNGMKRAKISLGCIFIKTFHVIDNLSNYDNKDTYNYVILEDPDTKEPMMIKVSSSLKEQFDEDKTYQIYFKNTEDYKYSYNDYQKLFKELKIVRVEEVKDSDDYIQENGCK